LSFLTLIVIYIYFTNPRKDDGLCQARECHRELKPVRWRHLLSYDYLKSLVEKDTSQSCILQLHFCHDFPFKRVLKIFYSGFLTTNNIAYILIHVIFKTLPSLFVFIVLDSVMHRLLFLGGALNPLL